jgi:hypothetical protein
MPYAHGLSLSSLAARPASPMLALVQPASTKQAALSVRIGESDGVYYLHHGRCVAARVGYYIDGIAAVTSLVGESSVDMRDVDSLARASGPSKRSVLGRKYSNAIKSAFLALQ